MKTITRPISKIELQELSQEIGGFFIKVVVDLDKKILVAGAKMHIDEEQELLKNGSIRENLWGGGYDLEEKKITFDSIINNRPGVNHSSEILEPAIREKFERIVRYLLDL